MLCDNQPLINFSRARVFCLVQENTDKDFPWGRDKPFWPCARARLKKGFLSQQRCNDDAVI